MDWTAGYPSDIDYTSGFYREQSPSHLNFACILHGYEPIPLDRQFTYFEIGFGRGLTANVLAASNPQGDFYAADFNPSHVAGAMHLATAARLTNLTLLENSFAELAQGKVDQLPQFDFITLHGVYTWVNAENRKHVVDFIARYLKPGGVVYVSYNTMPGWATVMPLQRLMVEHAALFPNRSDVQIEQAAAFVGKMIAAGSGYFEASPALASRLDTLKTGSPHYLVHEYMNRSGEALYHVDVARDLSAAKLNYVGSADLPVAYPALYLTRDKQALLESISDVAVRETFKDFLLNTGFRKDVFVRGARKMSAARQAECLQQTGLALLVPRANVTLKMKLSFGEINGREDIYRPVLDALADQPRGLMELVALLGAGGQSISALAHIAAVLTASGQASVYFVDGAGDVVDAAFRMNHVLAMQARYGDDYQALASPLLGNGVKAGLVERLVYLALVKDPGAQDVDAVARQVWQTMAAQGRQMVSDGKMCETEQENLAELAGQVGEVLSLKVPVWRMLKVI